MATVALESTGRRQSEERAEENSDWNNRESALGHTPRRRAQLLPGRETRRAKCAHEALPQTPPGGAPPETPGPLSLGIHVPERRESVKGSQAAQQRRALDRFPPFCRFP